MTLTARITDFQSGETLYSPFSDTHKVFIVESGYVMAYTYEETGKRRIHLIYGPGAYFPVLTTFRQTDQRATYEALTPVATEEYSRDNFLQAIEADGDFCRDVLAKTVGQLSIFADRIMDLQLTRLEDRLLTRIEALAGAHGVREGDYLILPYILKHHHVADMLGVERESVSRIIGGLRAQDNLHQNEAGYFSIHA